MTIYSLFYCFMYVDQSYSLSINFSQKFIDYFKNLRKLSQMQCFWKFYSENFCPLKKKFHIKLFKKAKRDLELDLPPLFCMIFEGKYFSWCVHLTDQISLSYYLYFVRYCIAIVCQPCYDIINFEINLIFLIKPGFLTKKIPFYSNK